MIFSRRLVFIFLCVFFETSVVSANLEKLNANQTQVLFFHGPTYKNVTKYLLTNAGDVVNHPQFKNNKTTCFIPDYFEPQIADTHYKPMVDPYNKLGGINLLIIDWGAPTMVKNMTKLKQPDVEQLAPLLTDWILKLRTHIDWKQFHLLTYARGCELGGMVARNIMKSGGKQKFKLARLTALAPTKSLKKGKKSVPDITSDDADFVDAIHTDAGIYGTFLKVGHADFWPNSGIGTQPACNYLLPRGSKDTCSQKRAWELWAESVTIAKQGGPQFCSYRASSYWEYLLNGLTNLGEPVVMGIDCDKKASGNYYLTTNRMSPYARGCEFNLIYVLM